MKTELKSSKLAPLVKSRLQELKKSLRLGSESEATAYLLEFYGEFYPSMRVVQHERFIKSARDMQKVQIMDLKAGSKSKETGANGSL
jgi:arginine decarboxylase-like protein